jgi:hypothetical protein
VAIEISKAVDEVSKNKNLQDPIYNTYIIHASSPERAWTLPHGRRMALDVVRYLVRYMVRTDFF